MPSETFERLNLEKKTRILKAARNEFTERVYEEAKVVNICKNANIPRITFYSYFSSLADIYKYLYTTLLQYDPKGSIADCRISSHISEWDEYYMKLIESDQGLRMLYKSMQSAPLKARMMHHIIMSLTHQYKLKLLSRKAYVAEFSEMKASLF